MRIKTKKRLSKTLRVLGWVYLALILTINSIILAYIAWVFAMLNNIFA